MKLCDLINKRRHELGLGWDRLTELTGRNLHHLGDPKREVKAFPDKATIFLLADVLELEVMAVALAALESLGIYPEPCDGTEVCGYTGENKRSASTEGVPEA